MRRIIMLKKIKQICTLNGIKITLNIFWYAQYIEIKEFL